MADFSPSKFPKFAREELQAAKQAAQLACYVCLDPAVTREHAFRQCTDAFQNLMKIIARNEQHKKAQEQRTQLLEKHLKEARSREQVLKEELEVLRATAAFCSDDQRDASTSTEEAASEEVSIVDI